MRLLLFIGSMISVGMGLLVAAMFDRGWPRAPWKWLSTVRALVGPALAAGAASAERPDDAVKWARWTVHHAERAGGRASGLGWQMDSALRIGIRAMVETNDVNGAIRWATACIERPIEREVDAWHRVLAAVSDVRGPVGLPALVVRARAALPPEDVGGALGLMAIAVASHVRRGRREAADAWRAEMLDLVEKAQGSGRLHDFTLADVGRIASVFDGEPVILQLLRSRVDPESSSEPRVPSADEDDPGAWYGLTRALVVNGLIEGAILSIELGRSAAEARPLDACSWLAPVEVGERLLAHQRWSDAVEMGRTAVSRGASSQLPTAIETPHVLLGRALFASGALDEARQVLEVALDRVDESSEPWSNHGRPDTRPRRKVVQAAGWYTLGRVHDALGSDPREVQRMFEKARSLASSHALLQGGTATDWILDGLAAQGSSGVDSRRTTVT